MAAAETARLIASLELQDKNFTRGLRKVERGVDRVDNKLGKFSGAINRNVGRAVDNLISRGIEAGGAVIQAAIDQESAITGIAKTVNGNIDAIVGDLKRLSTETGSTFEELAGIAELGGAMGIAKDDIAAFTEQVAILGATTDVSIEDAATALGQLQNVIGLTGDEFDNFSASLVDLGNKGASTEAAILEIAKRSGGAAKLFGIAKDETLGWASAVANLGIQEELAGTGLQNLFIKSMPAFIKGNKTLQQVTGKTAKQLKQAYEKDAGAALKSFIADLSELSEGDRLAAIQKLYGKGSGLTRILLGLTGDQNNLTDSLETGTKAWEEATAAQAEADKRFATSEFAFKRLNNTVNLAAATIGTELLPVLVDLAEEGMAWLQEPATQKAIKSFAVDLGKGLRSLATTVKGINWSGIADALGIAAGAAKTLVEAFLGMPAWVQAAVISGWGLNKITGGLIGDLASGLIKGVLGINAGIVHVNGPVAGAGGAAGGAAAAASRMARIANAVKILGAVTIAGASIALLAQQIGTFVEGVGRDQAALQEKVNKTSTQNFQETIANLNATNKNLQGLSGLDEILASVTGGGQITQNFEMAADRIIKAQGLTRTQTVDALSALKDSQQQAKELNLKTPKLDAAILALERRLAKPPPTGAPGAHRPKPETKPGTGAPGAFRPIVKAVNEQRSELNNMSNALATLKGTSAEQKTELSNIKNASATLNTSITTQTSAQTAELANIKNASATLNTTTNAGLVAATAATTAGNMLSVFQSASQVLAANSTTTAANNTTSAARNAGTTVAGSMAIAASRIVGAVNALDLSVNVTTVNRTSTVNNRYGPASGSSNGDRVGGGWR